METAIRRLNQATDFATLANTEIIKKQNEAIHVTADSILTIVTKNSELMAHLDQRLYEIPTIYDMEKLYKRFIHDSISQKPPASAQKSTAAVSRSQGGAEVVLR